MSGLRKTPNIQPERYSTPSARLFVALELIGAFVALAIILAAVITFAANRGAGLNLLGYLFWPLIIALTLSLSLGVMQVVRHVNWQTVLGLAVASLALAALIVIVSLEVCYYGRFFLAPFALA